jgi:hypothetical protein
MAEKSMLAYFHSNAAAQSIVTKLRALRITDVHIDTAGLNGSSANEADAAANTDEASLSASWLDGMSTASSGSERPDTLLTAVIDEATYEQALRVVREGGGVV